MKRLISQNWMAISSTNNKYAQFNKSYKAIIILLLFNVQVLAYCKFIPVQIWQLK